MQATAKFTSGDHWAERAEAGLRLLGSVDVASAGGPAKWDGPESLTGVLEGLASGKRIPAAGEMQPKLDAAPPPLEPGAAYLCVLMQVPTPRSEMISVEAGGVLFEDPFWAVLAARALSKQPRHAVPVAASNEALWRAAAELAGGKRMFEGDLGGLLSPASAEDEPKPVAIKLVTFKGEELQALRGRGMQSLALEDDVRFFELFMPPPK